MLLYIYQDVVLLPHSCNQSVEFEFEDVLFPSVMLLALLAGNLFGVRQNQAARLHHPA